MITLQEIKRPIRNFVRAHWSDERLAEVYCFNRDGKMRFMDPCGCFLGVTLASALHGTFLDHRGHLCTCDHYRKARALAGGIKAEQAYVSLGCFANSDRYDRLDCDLQRRRLSAILRAEMRRREQARRPEGAVAELAVAS